MSPAATSNERTYVLTINDFRTLAKKTKQELLPPRFGYDARNVRFDSQLGSIVKRGTRSIYGGMSSFGILPVMMVDRYYKNSDDTKALLTAYSTFLKKGNDSTGVFTNIKTGLTTGLRWNTLTFKDHWYGVNGTDSGQVYNGSAVETMGVPVPIAPSGVDSGVSGNPNGAYFYKVTYEIDSYQEGNASIASSVVNVSSKKVTLTIPVSTNTRVTARNIYRTVASGLIYYFVARVANNIDISYLDNIADGSLDTTITAPDDYGAPGAYKFMVLHSSRIFLSRTANGKSDVIYSDIRDGASYPEIFPVDNIFSILEDNGEENTGIMEDNFGQLICFKPSAVIRINTDTDDPVGWSGFTDIRSINGNISAYSLAKTNIGLIYLTRFAETRKHLMLWNGQGSEPIFDELEPILSSIPESRLSSVVGTYHGGKYELAYTDPDSGNDYNDRVLVIDLITQSWSIDEKNVNCFASFKAGTDIGEQYTGTSDATGLIYREDNTVTDLVIRFGVDLDLGTFSDHCEKGGTEIAPTIVFIPDLADEVSSDLVSSDTDIVSDLDDIEETAGPSASWISDVYETNSTSLSSIFWNFNAGTYGSAFLWVRTGSTEANCLAADWEGPFENSGDSLADVSANRFIQIKAQMNVDVDHISDYPNIYFYRNNYIFRVTFGFGTPIEEEINMYYESEWTDFNFISNNFGRVRKRFRQVRIDFDRTEPTGNFSFQYYLDNSDSLVTKTWDFSTYASKGFVVYQFPYSAISKRIKWNFLHDDDDKSLIIKAIHFQASVQPESDMITF